MFTDCQVNVDLNRDLLDCLLSAESEAEMPLHFVHCLTSGNATNAKTTCLQLVIAVCAVTFTRHCGCGIHPRGVHVCHETVRRSTLYYSPPTYSIRTYDCLERRLSQLFCAAQ